MKKRFLIYLFINILLVPVSINAYGQETQKDRYDRIREMEFRMNKLNNHPVEKKQERWTLITQVDDRKAFISNDISGELYVGEVVKNAARGYLRSGSGLCKSGKDYSLCSWKRDSMHGEGLKKRDDKVYFCKWKWGKVLTESVRPATEEEIEMINKEIERLEIMIRLSYERH